MKLRIIVLGSVLVLLNSGYVFTEGNMEESPAETITQEEKAEGDTAVKYCLLCGPEEETEDISISYKYKGEKYSFCSMDCLKAFKKDPEQYLSADRSDQEHAGHDHEK